MPRGRPRKGDDVLMKSAEFIGWAPGTRVWQYEPMPH
jgi:hypothetical protein